MARKKINKRKNEDWARIHCYYIWQINNEWPIVLYDWVVIEDLWDKVVCSMMNRNTNKSDEFFNITFSKNLIKLT